MRFDSSASGDETVRTQEPPRRVIPTQEGFGAHDLARVERHLGLELHDELVVVERAPQIAFDLQPFHHVRRRARVEELPAPAALLLREIHRQVGLLQEVGRAVLAARERDADARRHEQIVTIDHERRLQTLDDAISNMERVLRVVQSGQQHRELVAAEAGDDIGALRHEVRRSATLTSMRSPTS